MEPDPVDAAPALAWVEEQVGPVDLVGELTGGATSLMLALDSARGPLVLRLITREPWRTHGRELATRESETHRLLEGTGLDLPISVALDATGERAGHPAHLMTRLPGAPDEDLPDVDELVRVLAAIHDVAPTSAVRVYESWAWEAKYVVPAWATRPDAWASAFDLLRGPAPAYEPCFLHRDFQQRNVLWQDGRISGVVDWVETSVGPAWLDVAHCATNLAVRHGGDVAEAFAAAYAARTGRVPQPWFDVMDVVGFLPVPGRSEWFTDAGQRQRLEERLVVVLDRARGTVAG